MLLGMSSPDTNYLYVNANSEPVISLIPQKVMLIVLCGNHVCWAIT